MTSYLATSFDWVIWQQITPLWLLFVVNILAVHRVCRLIARDTLLMRPRERIAEKYHGALVTLMLCMWCLAFWIAAIVVCLTAWSATRDVWLVVASILAISDAVGFLSERA
jgi:uncharacterized membrane protein HdeD (DUF308 family)